MSRLCVFVCVCVCVCVYLARGLLGPLSFNNFGKFSQIFLLLHSLSYFFQEVLFCIYYTIITVFSLSLSLCRVCVCVCVCVYVCVNSFCLPMSHSGYFPLTQLPAYSLSSHVRIVICS